MVFIDTKSGKIEVKIPRNTADSAETYTLTLKSQGTNQTYTFSGLTDSGISEDYLTFSVNFNRVKEGEYEYSVGVEKGLIQIGKISHTATAYTDTREYIEYQG